MGSAHSSKRFRYRRISDSSSSKTLPLLQNQNQFMEIEYAVQEYLKELSALKKEIGSLKSNLCSLETEIHTAKPKYELGSTSKTKATEGNELQEEAIPNLEKKVEKLKKSLDEVILGREAQKRINSVEISKQGEAIQNIDKKNMNLEKKIAEMECRMNEISSTLVDMAALISQMNLQSPKPEIHTQQQVTNDKSSSLEEAPALRQARMTDITIKFSEDEIHVCLIILIFLISFLIGFNL